MFKKLFGKKSLKSRDTPYTENKFSGKILENSEYLYLNHKTMKKIVGSAHETVIMDKLKLTGQNLGRVFNSRSGCMYAMQLWCCESGRPNLKLKTQPKQLLCSLPLDIVIPDLT